MGESPLIYGAIIDAMGQVSAIAKGKRNATQGFSYRGIDDVMNELHGILAKCGIFVVPNVLEEERTTGTTAKGGNIFYTRQKIKFSFFAKDGSSIDAVVIGEAMDSGDKASNKALSIGLKYALLQVFCIPTEEDKDPDAVSPDYMPKKVEQKQEQPAEQNTSKRKELSQFILKYQAPLSDSPKTPTPYDMCVEALAGNDEEKIANMLERARAYVSKKGIQL